MDIYGLIGEKLGHSLSPYIYQTLVENKKNISYNLFEVKKENFNNVIKSAKVLGIKGCNVTIPYKQDIINQLDDISNEAKQIGAVNTIKFIDGKAIGYNTDYLGFKDMMELNDIKVFGNIFYVLGSGGSAKSVIQYLKDNKAKKIFVVTRNIEDKANKENVFYITYEDVKKEGYGYGIINTTPLGMYPHIHNSPVDKEVLKNFEVAIDLIYNPIETEFLKKSKELNKKTVSGMYMLVGQALNNWAIWNDIDVDYNNFNKVYKKLKELI